MKLISARNELEFQVHQMSEKYRALHLSEVHIYLPETLVELQEKTIDFNVVANAFDDKNKNTNLLQTKRNDLDWELHHLSLAFRKLETEERAYYKEHTDEVEIFYKRRDMKERFLNSEQREGNNEHAIERQLLEEERVFDTTGRIEYETHEAANFGEDLYRRLSKRERFSINHK